MAISCIVLDDDHDYGKLVSMYVMQNEKMDLRGTYMVQAEARKHLQAEPIQLLFIDVEMPEMNGLEFVRSLEEPPYAIFITSHPDFALESYELEAVDYILKPVNKLRIDKAINKAATLIDAKLAAQANVLLSEDDYFVVRTEAQFTRIKYADVRYIEAMSDFVKIYTPGHTFIALTSMKNVEKALPSAIFLRTHRSFMVNIKYITGITSYDVRVGEIEIPLSESYKEAVNERVIGDKLIKR